MRKAVSAEALSDLIGAIYDCVLAPEGWEAVLETMRIEFGFVTAALGVTSRKGDIQAIHASAGMVANAHALAAQLAPEMIELWGGLERAQAFPLDEPIIASRVSDPDNWADNPYYQAIAVPLEIHDGVGVSIVRTPAVVGHLGFGAHRSLGTIDDAYVAGLRLIAPHVRRAVTISDLFNLKAVEASTFASTIDALAVGVALLDEDCGIVHVNAAAATMLAANDPMGSLRGRLRLAHPAAQAALEATVRQAALDEAKLGQRGIAIPVRRENGEPCVLHVLPLKRGDIRRGIAQRATAALFIAPAAAPPRLPTDALTLIYDLTPTETRVFELICEGRTPAEIASLLGVAPSTVKTHLHRVFDKTGCSRQAELVKLAATLSLPV